MELGKTLYVTNRKQWRSWLAKNYKKEKEIRLIYYRKSSGRKRIPYNDAVEEALCFGWIDGIQKGERILLVDEWAETGSQIEAAINLLERAGGIIKGISLIGIEKNDKTLSILERYKVNVIGISPYK